MGYDNNYKIVIYTIFNIHQISVSCLQVSANKILWKGGKLKRHKGDLFDTISNQNIYIKKTILRILF